MDSIRTADPTITTAEEVGQGSRPLLPGIGGIAFGVLTAVFLLLASPVGGTYKVSDVKDFVASGHRPAIFASMYAAVLAVAGLLWLVSGIRNALASEAASRYGAGRAFMATGLAAAACFAVGYAITVSAPVAYAVASGGDAFSLPPATVYAIGEVGDAAIFGAGGILLAISLLMLAAWSTLPTWLRWVTGVAGVIGLASPAFFPWFALLVWSLVIGIWLLASSRARFT